MRGENLREMSKGDKILYTEHLTKAYDGENILKDCSIEVKEGEIYGILGPNGAGKTTLLKLLAGFIKPTEGKAVIRGVEVEPNKEKIQGEIGSLIETPIFYEELSARQNLEVHLKYMGTTGDIEKALSLAGLDYYNKKPVSKYSLGMRQRLAIARTFIHKPKVLILDEPVNGLDPIGLMEMRELFNKLASEGMTILISSHLLNEISQIANTVLVISKGRVIMEDSVKRLEEEHGKDLEKYLVEKMRRGSE
jgi:ABC-2 type transport system ATP-binding protein